MNQLDSDPDMLAALSALARGDYTTYCAWLTAQDVKNGLRSAGARGELRTGIHYLEADMQTHDRSRSAGERLAHELQGYGSFVTTTPDAYASATLRAAEIAEAMDPSVWPGYDPHGTPPDGYAIALRIRQLRTEDEARR